MAEIKLHLRNDDQGPFYMLGVTRTAPPGVRQRVLWWTWTGYRWASFREMEERAAGFRASAAGRLRG